ASNNTVTLSQNVVPAGITVSNAALTYTLNDSGGFKIGGAGSLTKQGSGTFVVDNTGPNDFSGGINISAGSLRFGNNDGNGAIPAGNIVNNGDLAVSRTDTITVGNQISGGGTVTKSSSGTLLLSGVNSFTGVVNVAAGTLQVGNGSALGATNGGTIVS